MRELPGIGPVTGEALEKAGFSSLSDLLRCFPVAYKDYTHPLTLAEAVPDTPHFYKAAVKSPPKCSRRYPGPHILKVQLEDPDSGTAADCTIFNQPYLAAKLKKGQTVFVDGTPREINGRLSFTAPSLLMKMPEDGIVPVYRSVSGITPARFRKAVRDAVLLTDAGDPFSQTFRDRFDVAELADAYSGVHMPRSMAETERARRRFSMENGLVTVRILDLIFAHTKAPTELLIGAAGYLQDYLALQPLAPTGAQLRSMQEISADLESGQTMNRLLEGDVGSGKTLVAFFAMYAAAREGYQSILMAPTEVLARQHAQAAAALFGEDRVAVLLGSQKPACRQNERLRIENGEVFYVIGTHALLYDVKFRRPALLITDEQQRFGVQQRRQLLGNEEVLHSLIMSATPIPRSLSLALHGITDISILDELPPGRRPVITRLVSPRKMQAMFDYAAKKAQEGERVYIVCPLIEKSETSALHAAESVFSGLKKQYPDLPVGLLHGKMDAAGKLAVMESFASGEISVLVSTTVIEVGVDVPEATIMIILDAERFGLAQLHQLRGRVGRGSRESWCFLCSGASGESRLGVLCRTNDGFAVAEADMHERGTGEFFGWQQSGNGNAAIDLQEPGLVSRLHEMLNDMAADPDLRGDFTYITHTAQQRIADRFQTVALN